MNKKIIIIGVIILLVAIIIGFGINIMLEPKIRVENISNEDTASTTVQMSSVKWMSPVKVENLDVFKDDFIKTGAVFYKVGVFTDGSYKDGDVLLADVATGFMDGDERYRFVNQLGKITLLAKHSNALYDEDSLNRAKFLIDNDTVLPDLIFPQKIKYATSNFSLQGNNLNETRAGEAYYSSVFKLADRYPKIKTLFTPRLVV